MNKKQIAVISSSKFPGTGGDTSNYSEMINQLDKEGFRVMLICPKNPGSNNKELGFSSNVKIIRIPYEPPNNKYEIKGGFKPRHYLRFLLFLLIETFIVFWELKKNNIKYVLIRHGLYTMQLPIIFRLLKIKAIADGDLIVDSIKDRINPILFRVIQKYENKTIRFYKHLKVSSNSHSDKLQKLGFPKGWPLVIPVGIDIEKVPKFSIEDIPEHTFGYFGILEKWQGIDILIKAFQLLHKKIPSAKLYILGKGPLESELKKMVTHFDLSSNVIFSTISREKLWHEYFRKFRIVIIPRPKQDNSADKILPIKLVESLAAGKPTIVMNIPIMNEVPRDSIFIVSSEDPESLAKAMELMSADKEIMKKYARSALFAASTYDIRIGMRQLVNGLIG